MQLPLSFDFKCKCLEIRSDRLGRGTPGLIWSLTGSKVYHGLSHGSTSTDLESVLKFRDPGNLTDRLLTEINFKSNLGRVGSLEIREIKIGLDWENSKPVEKRRHNISLRCYGRHSMLDWEPSEFSFSMYSIAPMNFIIEEILITAMENP